MAFGRDVVARLRADDRKLSPELRRARRKFQKFGRQVKRDLKRSFQGVRRNMTAVLGPGLVAAFALAGREAFRFEKRLLQLGIQAGKTDGEMAAFRGKLTEVSKATGVSRSELEAVASQFVTATGDFVTAEKSLGLFADVLQATGTNSEDLANVMAVLKTQFRDIKPEQMAEAFGVLAVAGKAGSVELKEMASELGRVAGSFQQFGGKDIAGLQQIASAFQVVQSRFGFSAEQARTGVKSFFDQLGKNKKKVRDVFGVDVRGKDLFQILDELKRTGRVNRDNLFKALGERKAVDAAEALVENLDEARKIQGQISDEGAGAIAKDAQRFRESDVGKMEASINALKQAFIDVFTPERIKKFTDLFGKLVPIVEFMLENIVGIGAAFVAMKGVQLGAFVAKMTALATAAGATKLAMLGWAGGIGAALAAGVAFGRMLDNWLGLSRRISDTLFEMIHGSDEDVGIGVSSKAQRAGLAADLARFTEGDKTAGKLAALQAERTLGVKRGQTKLTDAQREAILQGAGEDFGPGGAVKGAQLIERLESALQSVASQSAELTAAARANPDAAKVDVRVFVDPDSGQLMADVLRRSRETQVRREAAR